MPSISVIDLDILNFDRESHITQQQQQQQREQPGDFTMTMSSWSRNGSKKDGQNTRDRRKGIRRGQWRKNQNSEMKTESNQVNKAFRVVRIILQIMGRFPFRPHRKDDIDILKKTDVAVNSDLKWIGRNSLPVDSNQNERKRHNNFIGNIKNFFKYGDEHQEKVKDKVEDDECEEIEEEEVEEDAEDEYDKWMKIQGINQGGSCPSPYSYSLLSFHWFYFFFTSTFLLCVLILMSMGFAKVFLEWDYPDWFNYSSFLPEEKKIFQENLVPFVLVWSCLLHSTVGNISFIKNRKLVVDYLNEWERVVDTLELKLPSSIRTFLIGSNFWFIFFLLLVIIFYVSNFLPVAVGGAKLIGLLCLKPFMSNILQRDWFYEISIISIVTLVYSMYSSRALLFVYAYKCRLLKYGFKVWNKRLKEILNSSKYEMNEEQKEDEQSMCERLYRDHFTLLSMVKHTDKVFGGVLQSYYASQVLNMCFELYYLARSGSFTEGGNNKQDIFAAVLLLVQNISIFFTVSLDGAYVGDEAQRGVDILRTRVIQPHESIYKKYLVSSLHSSFHHRIVMTGGKFFCIDRPFVITVLGAVCTYFVIILQFGDRIQGSVN